MSAFRAVPLGAVLVFLSAALAASPQHEPSPPTAPATVAPASLQTAIHRLWENHPEVQAARARRDAARARAEAMARPLYNPELALESERADVDRRTAGLSLTLDLSGKRRARANLGQAGLAVSEADYTLVRRDVAARWLKAWSAMVLATRQSHLGERRLALMQRFDELAAQRLAVGDISSPERDLAGLALGEAQGQQAALVANEAAARASLQALGIDAVATLPLLPDNLPPGRTDMPPALAPDALPEGIQSLAERDRAEAGVLVARRARRPDPTLSLVGGQVRSGPRSDRVIGLNLSIPLPVLNSGCAEVEAARAEADAANADIEARRRALTASQQEAQTRYEALRQAAEAFSKGRAGAFEERSALLEKLWRAGEIDTSDYLVQLKQSLDTALSGLDLQSRAWQAWFDYLAAAGHLTDWVDGRQETFK